MKFRVLAGLLVLVGLAVLVSCGGYSSNTPSNPGVAGTSVIFVATQGDQKLSPFLIDNSTGKVTTNGNGVATGANPTAAVMTPDGSAIFVANRDSGDISRYTIKADGTLTAVTPAQAAGTNPTAMAMDGAGKFLFVLNQGAATASNASTIAVFSIGQGAALTAVGTPITGLDNSTGIAVTPDGKFLYATNSLLNTISGYAVDANGGVTSLGASIPTGVTPTGLVVTLDDPKNPSANDIYLYVSEANAGAGDIAVFHICDKVSINCVTPTGDLVPVTGSPFAAGGEPGTMFIVNPTVTTPPSGTFLYATDHKLNRVLQWSIALVTGALSPMSPPAVSSGTSPVWVSAKPNGQYVFAANNGSSSLSAYVITDPTKGNLTNAGTAVVPTGNSPSVVLVK